MLVGWSSMVFFENGELGRLLTSSIVGCGRLRRRNRLCVHLREVWWTLAFGDFGVMDAFEEGEV